MVRKLDFRFIHTAFNRRGAGRLGCAGQRYVAFASHQARSGVEPDPACTGQKHLAPGVQVGEIFFCAAGSVKRFDVGFQLNQVPRHKAGGQPQVAQQLHQQPAGVAARAECQRQRFLGGLHPRLHPDGVLDVLLQLLVDADQKVIGAARRSVNLVQIGLQQRRGRFNRQVRHQLLGHGWCVFERERFGFWFKEKVKRVQRDHVHHHVHRDLEFTRRLGEHQTGLVVRKRVLLPVDEMLCRLDFQGVRQNLRAAVRGRAQANDLRTERYQAVVLVMRDVAEGNVEGQGSSRLMLGGVCWP